MWYWWGKEEKKKARESWCVFCDAGILGFAAFCLVREDWVLSCRCRSHTSAAFQMMINDDHGPPVGTQGEKSRQGRAKKKERCYLPREGSTGLSQALIG